MNPIRKLAVVVVLLGSVSVAQADLVTFRIDSVMDLGCLVLCVGFEEDTGLDRADGPFFDVTVLFTIDTNAPGGGPIGGGYVFDQPSTGMSVTIGDLVLFADSYSFGIGPFFDGTRLSLNGTFGTGASSGFAIFDTNNSPLGLASDLPDRSLQTFATADLSGFSGTFYDTIVSPFGRFTRWWLQGGVRGIARVPEPGTLALLGIGLFGMGLSRRKRKHF